jgi:predicted metal-dependent hydrolase
MTKAALQDAKRTHVDPFQELVTKKTDLLAIETVLGPITLAVFDGPKTRAVPMDGGWRLERSPTISDVSFRRFLWKLLSIKLLEDVTTAVHHINAETFQVPVKTVTLKYMRSRWGSCSTKGTIALSTALLFTSPEVFRYVVIHELAHVLHMNHSARFWAAVAKFEPRYSLRTKELRTYKLSK